MNATIIDADHGMQLAYEELGDPAGVPLILIAGLGMQLHSWPDGFCELLTHRGYRVIRFDNRDCGRSTHLDYPPPGPLAMLGKHWHPGQYTLADMAADTVGLLDALEVPAAHLAGVSMGGMIAQTVAARYPERVRSLTSIMSTTGGRRVGRPALSTWRLMLARPPRDQAEAEDRTVRMFRHIGSAGFPFDEPWWRQYASRAWDRDPTSAGTGRQLGAIIRSGDRTAERAIPDARLETIKGMGHDLPSQVRPRVAGLIDSHIRVADSNRTVRGSGDGQES